MRKLQLHFCFMILIFGLNQSASAQCCTSDGRPTAVPAGFESTFTPNTAFPNSTLSPTNNAKGYTGNGTAIGMSNWAISSGAGAKLIRDASRATEGTDFVYVAYKASDPDSYCIENNINMSSGTTCAAGKFVTGKRYILSADYVVFNEAAPGGGTGKAAPIFDYLTAGYSPITAYVNGVKAVEETAVSWANVSASWKRAYGTVTTNNAVKRIAFSVENSNSNRATSGILYDNTKFEQLSVTASGIGTVTCSASNQARVFTLNPVSNFGGIPNLKYKVTAPAGYTISPLTGVYGQTTVFTLSKTTGSAIGAGAVNITIADEVNTNCSIVQPIAEPICCIIPLVTSITQAAATCNGLTPNNDATVTITTIGDKYATDTSTLYTAATAFSGSFTATNLTAGTLQTFRIFNRLETCFKDTTIRIATKLCPAQPCSNTIGGKVFNDYNSNGNIDTNDSLGFAGIKVYAINCAGVKIDSTITDYKGNYTFANVTAANDTVRIEFVASTFPSGLKPTYNGTDGRTDVQFAKAPNCNVSYGLVSTNDYCQANPDIMTTCFVAVSNLGADPALISFKLSEMNTPAQPFVNQINSLTKQFGQAPQMTEKAYATQSQVGTINGLAYHKESQTMFAAAFARVGSPLPHGLGAIYQLNNLMDVNPSSAVFVTVPNVGTGAIGQTDVGLKGLGGMAFSADQKTLYTINLNTRALVSIPLIGANLTPGAITETPIPAPTDCSTEYRPFAIRQHNGKLYIGVTCGSSTVANLKAYVYEYDGTTFVQKLVVPFNYARADAVANYYGYSGYPEYMQNNLNFVAWNTYPNLSILSSTATAKTQPWLTDIAFDGDDMILGVRSRLGDVLNNSYWVTGGDILRACPNSSASWTLENNGVCGGKTTQSPPPLVDPYTGAVNARTNSKGPGGYEYYWGDDGFEGEASQGTLLQIPGNPNVLVTQMDAIGHLGQAGVMALNNKTGRITAAGNVFFGYGPNAGATNNIGKSNGLGNLQAMCNPQPIQIGSRLWVDTDKDGVQDPCNEPGLSNVVVSLYDKLGNFIAKDTTNALGEYYFDATNVVDTSGAAKPNILGPQPNTPYFIVIGKETYAGAAQFDKTTGSITLSAKPYTLTTQNSTANSGNDLNDSDFSIGAGATPTALLGYPVLCATTPSAGADHTFDAGFKVACTKPTLTSASVVEGTCNGATPKNDAVVTLIGVANAIKGDKVIGTTYTNGPAFGAITNISPTGSDFIFTGLKHNTEYSFRIWNTDTTCYKDVNFLTPDKVCNSVCSIDITSSTKSVCRDNGAGQQVYDLTMTVSWSNPPSGEPIIITSDAGGSETIDPSLVTSPQTVKLVDLPADGQAVEATATFLATVSCIDTIKYNAPNCTCVLPTAGTNTTTEGSCTNNTPNNDAKITFTGVTGALKVDKVEGTTYTGGPSFGAASNVNASSGNFQLTGLKHSTTYTLRIWQSASCFIDVPITTPAKTCVLPCPPKICSPVKVTKL
jgi:hypothetical protein